VLDDVSGQLHSMAASPLVKKSHTHCTEDWVKTGASLDGCGKSCPPIGFNFWTVKPIANNYTNYANTAQNTDNFRKKEYQL